MSCKLNGIDISTFGALSSPARVALSINGLFDLPKRKGDTERNWGTEIEPWVDAADIELDGRIITLSVVIRGTTPAIYRDRLQAFKQACIECTTLETEFGSYHVIMKDDTGITEYTGHNTSSVLVKFWQETVTIPTLIVVPSAGAGYLLDNYNLQKDFGIAVSDIKGIENTGKRIEVNTTRPYPRTNYRDKSMVTMSCVMVGKSLMELYSQMTQFHALCVKPGLRALKTTDKQVINFYVKEGITVKAGHDTVITFDLKMRVI